MTSCSLSLSLDPAPLPRNRLSRTCFFGLNGFHTSAVHNKTYRPLSWMLLFCFVLEVFSFARHRHVRDHAIPRARRPGTPARHRPPRYKCRGSLATAEPDRSESTEKWILLVEDEEDLRKSIGNFLATEGGYRVTGVSDARSALLVCRGILRPNSRWSRFIFDRKFYLHLETGINATYNATAATDRFRRPDCLVVDIQLGSPQIPNGLELLQIIRADPMLEYLPVMLLTAKGNTDDRILGYEAGADAYLPKPFDPEELLSVVNGLTGRGLDTLSTGANQLTYGGLKSELTKLLAELKSLSEESVPLPKQLEMKGNAKKKSVSSKDILDPQSNSQAGATNPNVVDTFDSIEDSLTMEDMMLLDFLEQGFTVEEIMANTGSSKKRISNHLVALLTKTNLNSRTALVRWWRASREGNNT